MTTATRRKVKKEKPAFLPVGDPFTSHGFPCKIERDCDGGPTPYVMHVDQQVIGYARTEADALVTIDTYCDELAKLTKADTADMEAGKAEALPVEVTTPPLGQCVLCECAAWIITAAGLLCPDHAGALEEYQETLAVEPDPEVLAAVDRTRVRVLDAAFPSPLPADMAAERAAGVEEMMQAIPGTDPRICRMSPTGSHWTICGAPGDEPCMCNFVIVVSYGPDDPESRRRTMSPRVAAAQPDCPCGSSCPCCDPSHPDAIEQRIEREEAERGDPDLEAAGAIRSCFTCGREFISHGPRDILCSLCRAHLPAQRVRHGASLRDGG